MYSSDLYRGSVPSMAELTAMMFRFRSASTPFGTYLRENGYPDDVMTLYSDIMRPRAGVSDLFSAAYRGSGDFKQVDDELISRGFDDSDIAAFHANLQQLLDISTATQAKYRGLISEAQLRDLLHKYGYSDPDIETFIKAVEPLPNPADLIRFGVREAYQDDVAAAWGYDQDFPSGFAADMAKLGYTPEWAKYFWRAHWELPSVQLGMEMTHRGIISPDEFAGLLRLQDYPAGWRARMQQAIYTPYTRVDVRRMYGMGILDRAGVVKLYHDIGYDDEHAEKLADFTIKYEDENGASKKTTLHALSESTIRQAVQKGMLSDADAHAQLVGLDYAEEDADLLIRLAHWQKAISQKPEPIPEFNKDIRSIVERAYANRIIDKANALGQLAAVGYSGDEGELICQSVDYAVTEKNTEASIGLIRDQYLSGAIRDADVYTQLGALNLPATQQDALIATWDTALAYPARRLTEGQYRAAFKAGALDAEGYRQAVVDLGYAASDVELLVALYTGGTHAKA